jgi:hypothetical protein
MGFMMSMNKTTDTAKCKCSAGYKAGIMKTVHEA